MWILIKKKLKPHHIFGSEGFAKSLHRREAPYGRIQPRLAVILRCNYGAITVAALRQMNRTLSACSVICQYNFHTFFSIDTKRHYGVLAFLSVE